MTFDKEEFEKIIGITNDIKEKKDCKNKKDILIDVINILKEHSEYMDNINKALKCCDLIGIDDKLYKVIRYLLDYLVTSEANELIDWWLYEDVNHVLYSAETNEITDDLNKIEDLVDYILKNYPVK